MKAGSLNLLRYPRRFQLLSAPWGIWALSGGLLGLAAGVAWGLWSQAQRVPLQQQVQRLQARQAQQARAQTDAAERNRLAAQAQQAADRLQAWHSQREQLLRLHAVLTQAALDSGLQLRLWQGDERGLQLQGWLPRMDALPQLQAQLGAAGPWVWRLHSLSAGAGPGVELVLQAPWSSPSPSPSPSPSISPSKSGVPPSLPSSAAWVPEARP